jgi:putative ABC transport system permease protein
MRSKDIINLTLKNIVYRKTRSWLTILGIIIGIAAVVGLMGLGDAISESINVQLGGLGGDKLIITPGQAQQAFSRSADLEGPPTTSITSDVIGAEPLTEREAQAISRLPNVLAVSAMVQERYEVEFRSEFASLTVQFVDPVGAEAVEEPVIVDGRWLSSSDKNSCVLGHNVAKEIFSNEIRIGETITINGKNCRVTGILQEEGGFTGMDDYVVINLDAIDLFTDDYEDELSYINVRVSDTDKVGEVEELITELLLRLHNTKEEDFSILSFASIQERVSAITSLITAFLGGIAAISLVVGGIGISNTMLTSVMERTREIGILKAIGAKKSDVLLLFITESSIMSLIGGVIGLLVGLGLAQGIILLLPIAFTGGPSTQLKLVVNPLLLGGALTISMIIGVVSGFMPAKKAAELNPIEAIWYE